MSGVAFLLSAYKGDRPQVHAQLLPSLGGRSLDRAVYMALARRTATFSAERTNRLVAEEVLR
jgi:hypothetical protein